MTRHPQSAREVRVWDPWVRISHWLLAGAFFLAYFVVEEPLALHVWAGYLIGALIVIRILWGLAGPRHARFMDFVPTAARLKAYLGDLARGRERSYLGHNPLGGIMVVALLLSLTATVLSGLMVYGAEEKAGPLAGWYAAEGPAWSIAPVAPARADEEGHESGEGHEGLLQRPDAAQHGGAGHGNRQPGGADPGSARGRRGLHQPARASEPGPGHGDRPQARAGHRRTRMSRRLAAMFTYTVLIGATSVVTMTPNPAAADEDTPEIRQLYRQGEIRSLEAIIDRARERYPGARLVEAELLREGERLIYEVELIDAAGVMRELFFDARSGEAVSHRDEDSEDH